MSSVATSVETSFCRAAWSRQLPTRTARLFGDAQRQTVTTPSIFPTLRAGAKPEWTDGEYL